MYTYLRLSHPASAAPMGEEQSVTLCKQLSWKKSDIKTGWKMSSYGNKHKRHQPVFESTNCWLSDHPWITCLTYCEGMMFKNDSDTSMVLRCFEPFPRVVSTGPTSCQTTCYRPKLIKSTVKQTFDSTQLTRIYHNQSTAATPNPPNCVAKDVKKKQLQTLSSLAPSIPYCS